MNDSISRRAAIDALTDYIHNIDRVMGAGKLTMYDCKDAAESVLGEDELPSTDVPHWIPCSKRLPQNERKTYWVCTDVGSQHECRWTNNRYGLCESDTWGWSIFDIPESTEVVAWMPLPEPYKEGEQNG